MTIRIGSIPELRAYAKEWTQNIQPNTHVATIALLFGDLGAGKTAFVKEVASALGIGETIQSPTFVIERRYTCRDHRFNELVHIDAYRLGDKRDLEKLRWEETISSPKRLIMLEWPEQVKGIMLPEHVYQLEFRFIDEETREIHEL